MLMNIDFEEANNTDFYFIVNNKKVNLYDVIMSIVSVDKVCKEDGISQKNGINLLRDFVSEEFKQV